MNRKIVVSELQRIRDEVDALAKAFERGDKPAMYVTLAGIKHAASYIELEMKRPETAKAIDAARRRSHKALQAVLKS